MALMGPWVVPLTTPAMPTILYAPAEAVIPGKSMWTTLPKNPPVMAPRKREGAKIPPEPPEPMVMDVAMILNRIKNNRDDQESFPRRARSMAGYPTPRMWEQFLVMLRTYAI